MSINRLQNGAGAEVAVSLDILRKALLEAYGNQNKCRQSQVSSQVEFTQKEAEEIHTSYNEQAQQMLWDGMKDFATAGAGLIFQGFFAYRGNKATKNINECRNAKLNLKSYPTMEPPRAAKLEMGKQENVSEGVPVEKDAFIQRYQEVLGSDSKILRQSPDQFRDNESLLDLRRGEKAVDQQLTAVDKEQLTRIRTESDTKLDEEIRINEKTERDSLTQTQFFTQMVTASAGGTFGLFAKGNTQARGDAEMLKTVCELLAQLSKVAQDNSNAACQAVPQNIKAAADAMEASVYANGGYRG